MASLLILALIEFVRGALVFSLIPLFGRSIGFSLSIIGTAISLHYLMDNIFRIAAGWLTDRVGGKWIMAGGLVLSALGVYLLYVSRSGPLYILGAGLFGFGVAPVWPAVIAGVAARIPSHQLSEALSKVFIAWLVGAGLGPVLINFIIGQSYGLAFFVLIVALAAAVVLAAVFGVKQSTYEKDIPLTEFLKEIWQETISLKILYPGMFVQTMSVGILMPVIAIYARTVFGFSTEQFSYLLVGGGIFTVLLLIPAGKFADRLGVKGPLVGGFTVAALALILLPMQKVVTHALVVGIFIGVSYAFILPAWNGLQARVISPDKRGSMWAIFMTIEGIGTASGAYVGGKVWDTFGARAPFFASATVLLIMAVFYTFINMKKLIKESEGV